MRSFEFIEHLSLQDVLNTLFSMASFGVTVYFWFIRVNRERVSVKVYPVGPFEGTLESGGVGLWTGKLFLANRSILPTAIVEVQVELLWKGMWRSGRFFGGEGAEPPWNLKPQQVTPRLQVSAAFAVGEEVTREQIYEPQRLRFTFVTVEGWLIAHEFRTAERPA